MRCPECGSKQFSDNGLEVTCSRCGLIIDEQRLIADVTIFTRESAFDPRIATASGAGFNGRIVKNSWLFTRKEKNLIYVNKQIELLANRLRLTKQIITDTNILFAEVNKTGLLSGRTIDQFIVASLYHMCMVHGLPKTLVELSIHSGIHVKDIAQGYKLIKKRINLPIASISTMDLIPKYGSDIGLSAKATSRALELCNLHDKKLNSLSPRTKAVVFLYVASRLEKEKIAQRIFTNATGVIERVIRQRSKPLLQVVSKSS